MIICTDVGLKSIPPDKNVSFLPEIRDEDHLTPRPPAPVFLFSGIVPDTHKVLNKQNEWMNDSVFQDTLRKQKFAITQF